MTQSEELLLLENEVLEYQPDLVIVLFVPQNDIADMDRRTAINPLRPYYSIDEGDELELDTSFNQDKVERLKITMSLFGCE